MPRKSKGARLWLQPARRHDKGKVLEKAVWVIRDGNLKRSTGCSEAERSEAEKRLSEYIASKYEPRRDPQRDPRNIWIADTLSIYMDDVVPGQARPKETASRIEHLLDFFGNLRLSELSGKSCRNYAAARGSNSAARRELEELRAAANHSFKEGYCSSPVAVWLPPRSASRAKWLRRDEAAKLLWAAWRMHQSYKGEKTKRRTGKHLARFILVALYTGTRASSVCNAAIRPAMGRPYVDLSTGFSFGKLRGPNRQKSERHLSLFQIGSSHICEGGNVRGFPTNS